MRPKPWAAVSETHSGAGYDAYDRGIEVRATPSTSTSTLRLTADPAFRGDPSLLNREQLLVLAASSCQLLSLLAVAARSFAGSDPRS